MEDNFSRKMSNTYPTVESAELGLCLCVVSSFLGSCRSLNVRAYTEQTVFTH